MKFELALRLLRQPRAYLTSRTWRSGAAQAAPTMRRGVWGVVAHFSCGAVYAARQFRCANRQAGNLAHDPIGVVDTDGVRLDRLIRQRRRALGLTPSRWRVAWYRLAAIANTIVGILP